MPVYEYVKVSTGAVIEFVVPVADRDQVPGHKRITVPRRINVVSGAPDPTLPGQAVPRALKELEGTINHREIARQSGFSTEQMKQVWDIK